MTYYFMPMQLLYHFRFTIVGRDRDPIINIANPRNRTIQYNKLQLSTGCPVDYPVGMKL